MMILRVIILLLCFGFTLTSSVAQEQLNQITSVRWENNSLIIEATNKISYAEARLKDPDRLIIDILNATLPNSSLSKNFKTELDETVSVSEPIRGQIRIIFLGNASINRKSYLINNDDFKSTNFTSLFWFYINLISCSGTIKSDYFCKMGKQLFNC